MLLTILSHTPTFVWILLVALIGLGVRQMRPRRLGLGRVAVVPLLVIALSLANIVLGGARPGVALAIWALAFGLVAYGGGGLFAVRGARLLPGGAEVEVPGSRVPLVLILSLFVTKYVAAVMIAMQPVLAGDLLYVATTSALSGACSAVFYARARSLRSLPRPGLVALAA